MKAFLKYPGAKWALASWIVGMFPKHHSYLEPFLGSGATLFNKPPSNIETVNDLDGEVINLFECIRKDPEKVAWLINTTPYSREIYEKAYTAIPEDKYEQTLYFFVRCNMGHGFRVNGEKVGWKNDVQGRERAYALKAWNGLPEQLIPIVERLKQVQIESRPALQLISRFNHPNVLIYADPPYMLGTRHGKQYRHEMNDNDHEELLSALLQHKGPVILSGYESALYNNVLQGWYKETRTSYTRSMSKKAEVAWMNFEPAGQMVLR